MSTTDWAPRDARLLPAFEAWRRADHTAAHRAFTDYLRDDPASVDAWRGLGSVTWSQGRFADALDAFVAALRLDCANPVHWSDVGLANRDLGRRAQAVHAFEVAVALDATYAPAYNEWANVLVDAGSYDDARALYDIALSLDRSRAVYFHNRGVCAQLQGDPTRAAQDWRRALLLDPGYRWSQDELTRLGPTASVDRCRSGG